MQADAIGYDEGPWLTSISHDPGGTAYDLTLGFSYNPAGQIVATTRSDDSYSFTGHSNASVADSHDGLNRILTTGGAAVGHNSRGDIVALPTPDSPAGNVTEYSYFHEKPTFSRLGHIDPFIPPVRMCENCGCDQFSWHLNIRTTPLREQ